jgi:hypothetical protein
VIGDGHLVIHLWTAGDTEVGTAMSWVHDFGDSSAEPTSLLYPIEKSMVGDIRQFRHQSGKY